MSTVRRRATGLPSQRIGPEPGGGGRCSHRPVLPLNALPDHGEREPPTVPAKSTRTVNYLADLLRGHLKSIRATGLLRALFVLTNLEGAR